MRCVEGCPFKLYGSWDSKRECFVVKSVSNQYCCSKDMANTQMKSSWVAKQFLSIFKTKPHWPAREICDAVKIKYELSLASGWLTKLKVLHMGCYTGI